MSDFLGDLIELVVTVWRADSEVRNRSLLGQSEMEHQSRRSAAWICSGTIILFLLLVGFAWLWFSGDR